MVCWYRQQPPRSACARDAVCVLMLPGMRADVCAAQAVESAAALADTCNFERGSLHADG